MKLKVFDINDRNHLQYLYSFLVTNNVDLKLVFVLLLLSFSVFSSRDLYDRGMQYYYGDGVEQDYTKRLVRLSMRKVRGFRCANGVKYYVSKVMALVKMMPRGLIN